MSRMLHDYWEMLCCAIDKMSVGKTVAIGGGGSAVSFAMASSPHFYPQTLFELLGATGAALSIVLVLMKLWLTWIHRHKPPQ